MGMGDNDGVVMIGIGKSLNSDRLRVKRNGRDGKSKFNGVVMGFVMGYCGDGLKEEEGVLEVMGREKLKVW